MCVSIPNKIALNAFNFVFSPSAQNCLTCRRLFLCNLISIWILDSHFSGVKVLGNVDKSHLKCDVDVGRILIEGVKKVIAKEKEIKLCVWHVPEKKEGVCVKIVSVGRESPRARARSVDALVWYVSFYSRKFLTTFCSILSAKIGSDQKKKNISPWK